MRKFMNEKTTNKQSGVRPARPVNPCDSSLDKLEEWDSEGTELLLRLGTNPWNSGVLARKEVELISLALHCACTNLDETGTRRQIRAALDADATCEEIICVLKCGAAMATYSCSLGAPILLEEMKAAGVIAGAGAKPETPACDEMRKMGLWNTAWDPFYDLSPLWTEDLFAFAVSEIYKSGIFTARFIELISIAFEASITHMYAPGTRRHIQGALKAGATPEDIMTVLQICVSMGVHACSKGVPILAAALERQ
jgi:alkylhydroperoxidase/carboxymuconolactone decarboxylase family protein YurZ